MPGLEHEKGRNISERVAKLLVGQVASELGAHQAYLGTSLYFERQSLHRWAKLFRDQSVEEAGHASKIMAFLLDNEVEFDLPGLPAATTHYKSAAEAVGRRSRARSRSRASSTPWQRRDRRPATIAAHQFLQWFIDEQVEEERTMGALLDLLASGINLFQAQELLAGIAEG